MYLLREGKSFIYSVISAIPLTISIIFASAGFFALVSCSQDAAPIVMKGQNIYGRYNTHIKRVAREYRSDKSRKGIGASARQVEIGEGDTIYSLSKRYNITMKSIIRANDLQPPYILVKGSLIKIPDSSRRHIVKRGDTLYGIAKQYNISVNSLVALNNISAPYLISQNQKLILPSSVTTVQSSKYGNNSASGKKGGNSGKYSSSSGSKWKKNRFIWPVRGKVISKFGPKEGGRYNDGINIAASKGDLVVSAEDGTVAYVGNELKGYGNLIIVKHAGGWISAYAHCSEILVARGQKVNKNQAIAKIGVSGNVSKPQLYFGLRKGRKALNPESYLKRT